VIEYRCRPASLNGLGCRWVEHCGMARVKSLRDWPSGSSTVEWSDDGSSSFEGMLLPPEDGGRHRPCRRASHNLKARTGSCRETGVTPERICPRSAGPVASAIEYPSRPGRHRRRPGREFSQPFDRAGIPAPRPGQRCARRASPRRTGLPHRRPGPGAPRPERRRSRPSEARSLAAAAARPCR
jgi:hypothetical protein